MFHHSPPSSSQQQHTTTGATADMMMTPTTQRRPLQNLHLNQTTTPQQHNKPTPKAKDKALPLKQPVVPSSASNTASIVQDTAPSTMSTTVQLVQQQRQLRETKNDEIMLEQEVVLLPIFRRRSSSQIRSTIDAELDDLWTLKRANAVIDEDEDDDDDAVEQHHYDERLVASPTKRQRQELRWTDCCDLSSNSSILDRLTISSSSSSSDRYFL